MMRYLGSWLFWLGVGLAGIMMPGLVAAAEEPSVDGAATEAPSLEEYLLSFDYAQRRAMKIGSRQLLDLLLDDQAVLVDIRFSEEQQAWAMGFGLTIPLNELPRRLDELPRDKIIVTACPLKDRAIIAMTYLRTRGFEARYLTDGLLGLTRDLRGDDARFFLESLLED